MGIIWNVLLFQYFCYLAEYYLIAFRLALFGLSEKHPRSLSTRGLLGGGGEGGNIRKIPGENRSGQEEPQAVMLI